MSPEPPRKIYLLSTPCSGKTHFAAEYARYRDHRIVDFSPINKRATMDPAYGAKVAPGQDYFERILSFLQTQTEPICVLGRCGPDDPAKFAGIHLAAVLPPSEEHKRNSDARRLVDPKSKWADFDEVEDTRAMLIDYVKCRNMPLYRSFLEALSQLLGQ